MSPQDNRAKGNMNEPDKSETDGNPSANDDKVTHVKPDLFKGVQFCICDDVDAAEEVKKILVEGGGKLVNYLSDIATHLIASNPDHQDVCQAVEIYEKPVVTSRWVWLSAKAGCLLPTVAFSPLKNRLMSDIIACPSNLTREDLDSIWSMVTYHGGSFQIELNSKCTHLISSKSEGVKYEKALSVNDKIKIVTPDWVVDSIKGKRLCDEELYHPKLIISPDFKSELETETSIIPVSMPESVTITPATSMEQNNISSSATSTQVTLRTVSLPPSTMITSFSAPPGPMQQSRPLRVLVPSQNQEMTPVAPQQSGQPRQVYLALQHPQVRQQQVNFVQVRQHTPRGQGNEGAQLPVKPIILQQRIQPPALQQVQPQPQQSQTQQPQQPQQQQQQPPQLQLHQQQSQQLIHQIPQQQVHQQAQVQQPPQLQHLQHPQQQQLQIQQHQQYQQQQQQHIQQHYPPLKDGQTGIAHSSFVQNQQPPLHPQQQIQQPHQQQGQGQGQGQPQQQQQIQQLQHPHPQIPHQMQQQPKQQQQFAQIQQQPHMKQQQQYIQNQQYHLQNQQPIQNQTQQQPNQIAFKMGAPPNYPGLTGMVSPGVQYVNTMNQNQTVQDSNQQIRFVQGQQMIQVQRQQVAPMQQQRPPHMQQIQPGQQMMRGPIQQTQVFTSPPNNHDGMIQDMQQQNSVRMVQNQQFVEIQRHNTAPQMINISQHNGPHLIRTGSPQQIVYQGPPHQRPVMQGVQQVMQPGAPIYNQQGQQVAIGPSQVQRVPQLRMQPNFQQMPRGQFRGQVQTQQIVAGGQPRTLIRQGVPVQGQIIPRQGPPPVQHSYFQQAPQMVGVQQQQQPQQAAPTPQLLDQQHAIQNQIPAQQQPPHPQHPGVQLEPHSVQKPNQTLIRGQAGPSWSQQWATPPDSPMIPNQQRPFVRSPSNNLLIAQPNGPGTPQILHTPQHDGARKQLPFGNQTPVRIMHTVGHRFPVANQASEQLKQTAALASSLSNILPNGELIPSGPPTIEQLTERLFGHEPRILVPPSFCLAGCVFYFLDAEKNICSVSDERLQSCKKIVQKYGGDMEKSYSEKCTHVVCETQQNPIVQQALKEGKRCVTLFWLNDIILEGKMKPPFKIWHLPRAFDGDFLPCRDHIITLTNFEGTERVFVKELIKVTGAQYTNYLNHKNTILICKKLEGSKFRKALQWDMPVVNLTWLQDILFGHHNQALSALHKSQRYTKFESKDCCEIDYNLVKPLLAAWKVPLKVPEDLPRRIMALKEEDIRKKPSPPPVQPSPVQTPTSVQPPLPSTQPSTAPQPPQAPVTLQQPPPQLPTQQHLPPVLPSLPSLPPLPSSMTTVESMEIDQIPDAPKPVPTLIAKKPENTIPSLASLEINDNKDCLSNEPTMKKVKLEPSNEGSTNENLTGNLPPPPPLMVAPFANASPDRAAVKVMFTGYNDAALLNELKEYAKKLGLTLTNEYNKCTHLIVNRIARTSKFMCAFNYADHILTSDWIVDSFKRSHLLDESLYILSDPKGEHLYGFDLKESLARRKARKTPLFKDHVFYITRSCLPSFKILKEIAESAGAVVTKKGPSPKQLHALKKRRNDIIFAVITKEEDLHTCDLFFEKETHVLNSEFILHSLLRQEIEYEPYTFKSP